MCLDKNKLDGSTKVNYKYFGFLPINLLYKKCAIMFTFKKIPINNNIYSKRNMTYYDSQIIILKKYWTKICSLFRTYFF